MWLAYLSEGARDSCRDAVTDFCLERLDYSVSVVRIKNTEAVKTLTNS